MARITEIRGREDLLRRQTVQLELPRFLIRVFEKEIEKANVGASEDEWLTLSLRARRIALLEAEISAPGREVAYLIAACQQFGAGA